LRREIAFFIVACAAALGCQAPPALKVDVPPPDASAPQDVPAPAADAATDADARAGGDAAPEAPRPDPFADSRAACHFGAGARVTETLPITAAERAALPIKHVIVVMKENRAFDHLLGHLHDSGQPGVEAIPAGFTNLDLNNQPVAPFPLQTTCVDLDPGHQWDDMHAEVDNGAMDGFVSNAALSTGDDGHFVMGNYAASDVPFYYWLASTFAINDRHFPSVRSGTWPNRAFLLLGTADGVRCTYCKMPKPTTPSIFDSLTRAGVSWAAFTDSDPFDGTLGWTDTHPGVHSFVDFQNALKDGSLPAVSFVDGIAWLEDEHPTADVQVGENWTRLVYESVVASPLWPSIAMVWTYDEAGGFADHVPPPNTACVARPGNPEDAPFFELGVRVPLVMISPWARPGFASHVVQDHTSITRLIEAVFDLPALTSRDANSTALLDMFDFSGAPPMLHPPDAPLAGKGGCHGDVVLQSDKPSYPSASPLSIRISWTGVAAPQDHDRIGIFRYPRGAMDVPTEMNPIIPLAWAYIGGHGQTPGGAPASGEVVLDASAVSAGAPWPLPPGLWMADYLPALPSGDDGHTASASVLLEVTP
jgi:phospholipase C